MMNITKIKRFVMGALVRALFVRNINKTNNKQHVNRGYDSESGTTIQSRLVRFARCNPDGHEGEPVKTRCNAVTCCWKKGS
ncbi:hypothetical protein UM55_001365 [Salmonella enterica subsp. enterica serovar Oranienburg]|nr:hypothetical protein [Salmonella enterica]ECF6266209.1 hypothetical protein [Salmonella enterica subsp. arizonae]EDW2494219.1 hypothetical protein [Salmonella enterica subsp. enterica serovar Oranienburg]EAR7992440.1 hypothetical protein [Salmonella enterica]EAX9063820.1 hypothetical protein [Salmonella enterica]